jgi:hypothetical protein
LIARVGSAYLAGNALRSLKSKDILTEIGSSTRPIREDFVIWRSKDVKARGDAIVNCR